jgi:hypothetical protein
MNGVMGVVSGCYQEVWIDYPAFSVNYVIGIHRVNVMDKDATVDFSTRNTKITTVITDNNLVSDSFPLR